MPGDIFARAPEPPFPAYEGSAPYLFVSYSHADSEAVFADLAALRAAGFRIWYDEGIDPGSEWPASIQRAAEGCSLFLVFLSPRAVESLPVRNEINYAQAHRIPFLAIHLEPTELQHGLALQLGSVQAILKYSLTQERYRTKLEGALPPALREVPQARSSSTSANAIAQVAPTRAQLLELAPYGQMVNWDLKSPYYTIGRQHSLIVLPSKRVSRQHAVMARLNGEWVLVRVSKKNRVWVAGWEVRQKTLRDGDILQIGDRWLVFCGATDGKTYPQRRMGGRWGQPPSKRVLPDSASGKHLDQTLVGFRAPGAGFDLGGLGDGEEEGELTLFGQKGPDEDDVAFKLPSADEDAEVMEFEMTEDSDLDIGLSWEDDEEERQGGFCQVFGPSDVVSSDSVDRPLLIGSHPQCGVRVPGIAPFHCFLTWMPRGLCLFDLGSGKGTLLDGKPSRYAIVRDRQVITVGAQSLQVEVRGDPQEPASRRNSRTPRSLRLSVVHGPHKGESALLGVDREYLLGRLPECDLALTEDKRISREHLCLKVELSRQDGLILRIRDQSGRGTATINKEPLVGEGVAGAGDLLHFSPDPKTVSGTAVFVHFDTHESPI